MLSPDDARLLERLHGDLPLTERPFADEVLNCLSENSLRLSRFFRRHFAERAHVVDS